MNTRTPHTTVLPGLVLHTERGNFLAVHSVNRMFIDLIDIGNNSIVCCSAHTHNDGSCTVDDFAPFIYEQDVYQTSSLKDTFAPTPEPTPLPKINIRCDSSVGPAYGSTYLRVNHVELEDDGSYTAVTSHWPTFAPTPPMANPDLSDPYCTHGPFRDAHLTLAVLDAVNSCQIEMAIEHARRANPEMSYTHAEDFVLYLMED